MKNPAEFAGEPVCLFASLPDTWETMDNRVAERTLGDEIQRPILFDV